MLYTVSWLPLITFSHSVCKSLPSFAAWIEFVIIILPHHSLLWIKTLIFNETWHWEFDFCRLKRQKEKKST